MDKVTAIAHIVASGRNEQGSKADLKRVIKACKKLALTTLETIQVLTYLDYCDQLGKPYRHEYLPIMEGLLLAQPETEAAQIKEWEERQHG